MSWGVLMTRTLPQFVDDDKATNQRLSQKVTMCSVRDMENDSAQAPQYAAIGERLTRIREAFSDLSQKAWAERHGFNRTQYNNWETGTRRIPVEHAEKLADLYGLDLDFIFRGKRSGLDENASKLL